MTGNNLNLKETTPDEIAKRLIDAIPNENEESAFIDHGSERMQLEKEGQSQNEDLSPSSPKE